MNKAKLSFGVLLELLAIGGFLLNYHISASHPALIKIFKESLFFWTVIVIPIDIFCVCLFGVGCGMVYNSLPQAYKWIPNALIRIIGGLLCIAIGLSDLKIESLGIIVFGIAAVVIGFLMLQKILRHAKNAGAIKSQQSNS